MMSSGSSTDRGGPGRDSGFQAWHFYLLLSMGGATWAVIVSRHTHPAALLLISAAAIAAGFGALALYQALSGFFGVNIADAPVSARTREFLEQEKALVLRSIKELEFDRAMRKIGDKDFEEISSRLRARAVEIMSDLDRDAGQTRGPESRALSPAHGPKRSKSSGLRSQTLGVKAQDAVLRTRQDRGLCGSCHTQNDADARFCKQCGTALS